MLRLQTLYHQIDPGETLPTKYQQTPNMSYVSYVSQQVKHTWILAMVGI